VSDWGQLNLREVVGGREGVNLREVRKRGKKGGSVLWEVFVSETIVVELGWRWTDVRWFLTEDGSEDGKEKDDHEDAVRIE